MRHVWGASGRGGTGAAARVARGRRRGGGRQDALGPCHGRDGARKVFVCLFVCLFVCFDCLLRSAAAAAAAARGHCRVCVCVCACVCGRGGSHRQCVPPAPTPPACAQMWLSNDFVEERRWKATKGRTLARAAEKHAEGRKMHGITVAKVRACGVLCGRQVVARAHDQSLRDRARRRSGGSSRGASHAAWRASGSRSISSLCTSTVRCLRPSIAVLWTSAGVASVRGLGWC